jgi:hypothetical protein
MLSTGWIFGRFTQKGQKKRIKSMKSRLSRQICGRIFADFKQKGPKRGWTSGKLVFLLLFYASPRNIIVFLLTKIILFLKAKNAFKGKIAWGPIFFHSGWIFRQIDQKSLPWVGNTAWCVVKYICQRVHITLHKAPSSHGTVLWVTYMTPSFK